MTTSRSEDGRIIRIAAAVIVDSQGRTLLVRKRGTDVFMQPGGKRDEGETGLQTLARELREELDCGLAGDGRWLGRFTAPAANEPGAVVEADLFAIELEGEIRPAAEIEEAVWHDLADEDRPLAPLTRAHVLPLIATPARLA